MLFNEFPHIVEVFTKTSVEDDGGGYTETETKVKSLKCFVDTPFSNERFQAAKLDFSLDRYLYFRYKDLEYLAKDMKLKYLGKEYEFVSDFEDQGGQQEILRAAIRKCR